MTYVVVTRGRLKGALGWINGDLADRLKQLGPDAQVQFRSLDKDFRVPPSLVRARNLSRRKQFRDRGQTPMTRDASLIMCIVVGAALILAVAGVYFGWGENRDDL